MNFSIKRCNFKQKCVKNLQKENYRKNHGTMQENLLKANELKITMAGIQNLVKQTEGSKQEDGITA